MQMMADSKGRGTIYFILFIPKRRLVYMTHIASDNSIVTHTHIHIECTLAQIDRRTAKSVSQVTM
jgi:hypothetical protein